MQHFARPRFCYTPPVNSRFELLIFLNIAIDVVKLCFGEKIAEDELKKHHSTDRDASKAIQGAMNGGAKAVDTVAKAAKPVPVGKKIVWRKLRLEDKMSEIGGSGTALNNALEKVLGKNAPAVSQKVGGAATRLQSVTGSKLFGEIADGVSGTRLLLSLPGKFHDNALNHQKREELRKKVSALITGHFQTVMTYVKEDAKKRAREIERSYAVGGYCGEECAVFDDALIQIRRIREAL